MDMWVTSLKGHDVLPPCISDGGWGCCLLVSSLHCVFLQVATHFHSGCTKACDEEQINVRICTRVSCPASLSLYVCEVLNWQWIPAPVTWPWTACLISPHALTNQVTVHTHQLPFSMWDLWQLHHSAITVNCMCWGNIKARYASLTNLTTILCSNNEEKKKFGSTVQPIVDFSYHLL